MTCLAECTKEVVEPVRKAITFEFFASAFIDLSIWLIISEYSSTMSYKPTSAFSIYAFISL